MFDFKRKEILALSIIIILLGSFVIYKSFQDKSEDIIIESLPKEDLINENLKKNDIISDEENIEIEKIKEIMVDVCGAVLYPGVVKLDEGSRVIDAIDLAGGMLDTVDRKKVNLARIVEDGEQIYIPEIGEVIEETNNIITSNNYRQNKVNINNASQAELETLSGIGEVLAGRIIDYRESNGKFTDIKNIMNVSGIGTKKFEDIKDRISIQ